MDSRGWHRLVGGASILVGGLMVVAIAVHAVAVTGAARNERGGLDERWAVLQLIGVLAATAGAVLAAGGWSLWRPHRPARDGMAATGTAALFLALLLSVTGVLGPIGPVAYGLYLVVLGVAARKLDVWKHRGAAA